MPYDPHRVMRYGAEQRAKRLLTKLTPEEFQAKCAERQVSSVRELEQMLTEEIYLLDSEGLLFWPVAKLRRKARELQVSPNADPVTLAHQVTIAWATKSLRNKKHD